MDRRTLKSIIVEYRDKESKTFAEIADILKNEYGINRTRQAIQAVYAREIKKKTEDKIKSYYEIDVINLSAIGYPMIEICEIMGNLGREISYYKVRNIVSMESEFIEDIKEELTFKAVNMILHGSSMQKIKHELAYKGIVPEDRGFKDIIVAAYTMIVMNAAKNEIVKAYRDTEDKDIIKDIIKNTGLNISLAEIKMRA